MLFRALDLIVSLGYLCVNRSKCSDSVLTVPNREIFLEIIFLKLDFKLLVTGYVINYLTADCHMPNRKEGKWQWDFSALGKCLL